MKYAFILNPAAGKSRNPDYWIDQIEGFCRERHVNYVLWKTKKPGHGKSLAEDAVEKGFECIVAVGGDGTINEIARVLIHSKVCLGIVPKGSGNGFAREFGIPLTPREACENLLRSRPLAIDVGKINEEYFFNVAGFGLDAQIGYAFNQKQRGGRRGKLPYFTLGFTEYISYKPVSVTLDYNQKKLSLTPLLVAIANCKQYGSGAIIAPEAVVNDGFLHLAIVEQAPWYKLVWYLPMIFNGTFNHAPFLKTILTKEVTITSEKEIPYHLDGEIRTGRKLSAKILPQALTLLVPQEYKV